MTRLSIFFAFILFTSASYAQSVSSRDYSMMLSDLLSHTVNEVDVEQLKDLENVILLDAREKGEYKVSHLEGSIWVGYNQFQKQAIKDIPKDKKIVVYCSVGYRSEKIAEKLLSMGYEDVSNLYGGIFEWSNQQQPVVNDTGKTKAVHPYDQDWGKWLIYGDKVYK